MIKSIPNKPRLFVDADVLFAGAASPNEHSASLLILRLAEITLIDAVTSRQVITEVERNLQVKLPAALLLMRLLVSRCLRVVPDPTPGQVMAHHGEAQEKDLPILVAALQARCDWLVTFNLHHFQPGHARLSVLPPGDFILGLRSHLAEWTLNKKE